MCADTTAPAGIKMRAIEARVELIDGRTVARASEEMRGVGVTLPSKALAARFNVHGETPHAVWCPFCYRMARYHPLFVRFAHIGFRAENRGQGRVAWTCGQIAFACDDGHLTWIDKNGHVWSKEA